MKQTTKTPPKEKETEKSSAGYYVSVATPDGGLNFRSGPGEEFDRIISGRIPDGTVLYIEEASGNWGYTEFEGKKGWVALKQTIKTEPPQKVVEEVSEEAYEEVKEDDEKIVKSSMTQLIILITVIIILIIIISLAILTIINLNANKRG